MKYAILAVLLMCGVVRADFKLIAQPNTFIEEEIFIIERSTNIYFESKNTWSVIKDTQIFTLSEFVSSGKFCEWRKGGHEWKQFYNPDPFSGGGGCWKCIICEKCRRKIKKTKEVMEWE